MLLCVPESEIVRFGKRKLFFFLMISFPTNPSGADIHASYDINQRFKLRHFCKCRRISTNPMKLSLPTHIDHFPIDFIAFGMKNGCLSSTKLIVRLFFLFWTLFFLSRFQVLSEMDFFPYWFCNEKISCSQSKLIRCCALHIRIDILEVDIYTHYTCWNEIGKKGITFATRYLLNGTREQQKKNEPEQRKCFHVKACGICTHSHIHIEKCENHLL